MIRVAKKIGRATWLVADLTSSSVNSSVGFASRRRRMFSVTTIAPSTITPKSSAPSDSMLADIWAAFIRTKMETTASGMVTATTSALRGLPRNSIRTTITRPMPSSTVWPILLDGRLDEIAAVENGDDVNIFGFELLAQLLHLGVDAVDDVRHVLVFETHDDALDRRRVLVEAQDAFGLLVGVAQGPEIADQDRHAVGLRHDDIAEVVEGVHEPDAADDEALVAARHPAAARIGGVVVDRVDDVVDPEPVAQELGRVEIEPELPGEARRNCRRRRHLAPAAAPAGRSSADTPTAPSGSWCRIRACNGRSPAPAPTPRRARRRRPAAG